jgi:hypothetical protein
VLDRPESIEPDSLTGDDRRVQLEEVREMARKWEHGAQVPHAEAA